MQEEYLHYLFKNNILGAVFETTNGEKLEVIHSGYHNHNSGPDFQESLIYFDDKKWAGQIEFHVKSSDWNRHQHQYDVNYNNVIAHFVFDHDEDIYIDQFKLPTIEIKDLIDQHHYKHYLEFKASENWIPCENTIDKVDESTIRQQKEIATQNRLIRKSNEIIEKLNSTQGDRRKVFLITIAKVFGAKVNQIPFIRLANKINLSHLSRMDYDRDKIELYLFGLAGFLHEAGCPDDQSKKMRSEFLYLKQLFDLEEMSITEWKFSRMRPSNFPTIRLAQFAALISKYKDLYLLIDVKTFGALDIEINTYWQEHYHFSKRTTRKNTGLSKAFKILLLVNAHIPFNYALAKIEGLESVKNNAIKHLQEIPGEVNGIIEKWKSLNLEVNSAFDSQSLIELKNEYCANKKCLSCKIGLKLLSCTA